MSLFRDYARKHFHPLGIRIIGWNLLFLIIIKMIVPQSAFQLASFINSIPIFDSREVIKLTNESRVANNLKPLRANLQLDLAASEKLKNMATEEYFSHISPSGVSPWFWIKQSQYQYRVAGENLAIGFFTAKSTVDAWLNSPSHRANILNHLYIDIGVAVKAVEINGNNGILVVQMFGLPVQVVSSPGNLAQVQHSTVVKLIPNNMAQTAVISHPSSQIVSPLSQTRGESIALQYISTNEGTEPVTEPIAVKYKNTSHTKAVSRLLNNFFSIYILLIAIASFIALILFERNQSMALKMSLNIAMFIISIIVPAAQITLEGSIF